MVRKPILCAGYRKLDGSVLVTARCSNIGCYDQHLIFKISEDADKQVLEQECKGDVYILPEDKRDYILVNKDRLPLDEGTK